MKKVKDWSQQTWIHKANLLWINNGKVIETILSNVPYPVAKSKKRELDHTRNYKPGVLIVVSVNQK